MNNETKEFYVEKIEKYDKKLGTSDNAIIVGCIGLFIVVSYVISSLTGMTPPGFADPSPRLNIIMAFLSTPAVIPLIAGFATRIGINARIDEIRDFFAIHGLILEDEIAKGKGM